MRWQYWDREWKTYDDAMCARLEACLQEGPDGASGGIVQFNVGRTPYRVDIQVTSQLNDSTGYERPLQRLADAPPAEAWHWRNTAQWADFSADASAHLSAMRHAGWHSVVLCASLPHGCVLYEVDLLRMVQTNLSSGYERDICAGPPPPPPVRLTFTATDTDAVDLAAVTGWQVLRPAVDYDAAQLCPITAEPLGDGGGGGGGGGGGPGDNGGGDRVVRLSCSSHSSGPSTGAGDTGLRQQCVLRVSTVAAALAASPCCPLCGSRFALPGPQVSDSLCAALLLRACTVMHPPPRSSSRLSHPLRVSISLSRPKPQTRFPATDSVNNPRDPHSPRGR